MSTVAKAKTKRKQPYWFKACVGEAVLLTRETEERRLTVVRTVPGDDGGVEIEFGAALCLWLPRHQPVAVEFNGSRVTISAGRIRDSSCRLAITAPMPVGVKRPRSAAKEAAA